MQPHSRSMPPIAQTKDHDPVADFAGALSRVFARMIAHRATIVSTESLQTISYR
jgi:hypothetical protein